MSDKEERLYQYLENERKYLREEMHKLKDCQINYMRNAIITPALVFSVMRAFNEKSEAGISAGLYLVPLIVLLPSWLIFFDKATTLSRAVGYYRVLESILLNTVVATKFVGWENALQKFRSQKRIFKFNSYMKWLQFPITPFIYRSSRYWFYCYYTFFCVSWISCVIAFYFYEIPSMSTFFKGFFNTDYLALKVSITLTTVISLWNSWVLTQNIIGKTTHAANEYIWKSVMEIIDLDVVKKLIELGYIGDGLEKLSYKMYIEEIKRFQQDSDLIPDGIVGPKTRENLGIE